MSFRISNTLVVATLVVLASFPHARGRVYKERIQPQWAADGTHFWYRNDLSGGRREFVFVDLETGTRRLAFDHGRMAIALEDAGVGGAKASQLPIGDLEFDQDGKTLVFRAKGQYFRCSLGSYRLEKIDAPKLARKKKEAEVERSEKKRRPEFRASRDVSPDGKWKAFVRDHNVFLCPAEGGDSEATRLSDDGEEKNGYEAPYWAGNSKTLVAFRVQPDEVGEVHLVESSPEGGGRAKLHSRRYALPGDKFAIHELNMFDVEKRSHVKPEVGLIDFKRPRLRWSPDGRCFRYEKIDRGHQRFRVVEVDTNTGKTRNLVDEFSETFIWTDHMQNLGAPRVSWMARSDEIVYLSEQDGWRHLYLVDIGTAKMRQITKGEFVVRRVNWIDEEKRQIWFCASGLNEGEDPYLVHCYRVNFDGSGFTALTEGNGDHAIQYSPDRKFLIDTWSRVDMAPVHALRRVSDGKFLCALEETDTSELESRGWEPPEVFSAKGRDGKTDIWGIVCRPKDFDPARKYPVLENMYAGPHDAYVPKRWSSGRRFAQWTDMGFVVVKIDGMGTANRSKAFHDVCWQNLKDAGFPDRILWHKAYAARHPWYDISRVGIYGGSAGGQSSTGALLFHPDFYKVAVSSCGCHDNRMDKASWNEQWMGYPVGPQYAASSNIENAHRLRGKLLLIVGEMDRNVPTESTYRLVDALIRAEKDFEFVMVPGAGHGGGGSYGERRRRDFFRRHLLGLDPPDRNGEVYE